MCGADDIWVFHEVAPITFELFHSAAFYSRLSRIADRHSMVYVTSSGCSFSDSADVGS